MALSKKRYSSIRLRLIVFSAALFLAIVAVGGAAFLFSMEKIIKENVGSEMVRLLELERMRLESSVAGEIAIALKMAGSPLIIKHFLNPADEELRKTAFEEIDGYRRAFGSKTVFWISDKDKRFHSDNAYVYTVDPEDPGNYWYPMTLKMPLDEKYNFNINYNEQMQKIMLWINALVRDGADNPIGVLGTGIDLSSFTNTIYDDYNGRADLYFFNELEEITGAKDTRLVTEKRKINEVLGAELGGEIFGAARALETGAVRSFGITHGEIAVVSIPTLHWYAAAILPITRSDYDSTMTAFFTVVLIVIAVIFIVFNIFIWRITGPLKKMADTLRQTSVDWDLTRRVSVRRNDEIGTVADSVNEFFEKIHTIIEKLRVNTVTIAGASEELSRVSKQLASGSETTVSQSSVVVKTMDGMVSNISAMADGADRASKSVESVAGAAENMRESMTTIDGAIKEMSVGISRIAGNAEEVNKIAAEAKGMANAATEAMNKLSASAKEIGRFTDAIKDIAKKTNLLSINATVEAARAGDAGKGFAVVAGEVKQLATQSAESADDITARIESIQAETQNAAEVINEVAGIIAKINKSVEDISAHIDRQAKASNNIEQGIAQTNTNAQRVADAIGDVSKSAAEVSRNASVAAQGASDVSSSAEGMHKAARDGASNAERVNEKAGDLEKVAEELKETVNQFKAGGDFSCD